MLEDFEDGHDDRRTLAQDAQRLLGATAEDSIDASHSEAVDDVLRETERDELGDGKAFALQQNDVSVSS